MVGRYPQHIVDNTARTVDKWNRCSKIEQLRFIGLLVHEFEGSGGCGGKDGRRLYN